MPAGDKTGPAGKGPGTGRRLGGCLPGKSGFIGGVGKGRTKRGIGRRRRFGPPPIGFGRGFLRGN